MYENGTGVKQNSENAVKLYKEAIKNGRKEARYDLAMIYLRGKGVEKNSNLGLELLELAASENNKDAQFSLAELYEK